VQFHTNLEKKLPNKLIEQWTVNEGIIYINKGICNRATSVMKEVNRLVEKKIETNDMFLVDC
jgi:hypothetical protein